MKYFSISEIEKEIIEVKFLQGLPVGSQGGNASPHFELKELVTKTACRGIICDISNSDYQYGDYVSAVWIIGVSAKKKTCAVARDEQVANLKELMKLTFQVPVFTSHAEAIAFINLA